MTDAKTLLALGAVLSFLAVAMGAFGAHALKGQITPDLLPAYQTAAQYHAIHALALLLVGVLARDYPGPLVSLAGIAFLAGILLFSGSLYLLAITGIRWLGAITPIGGIAFLLGWGSLAWAMIKK